MGDQFHLQSPDMDRDAQKAERERQARAQDAIKAAEEKRAKDNPPDKVHPATPGTIAASAADAAERQRVETLSHNAQAKLDAKGIGGAGGH